MSQPLDHVMLGGPHVEAHNAERDDINKLLTDVTNLANQIAAKPSTSDIVQATRYRHYQTVALMTWTITHNLGYRPNVVVVDSTFNQIFPGQIHYTDDNTVVLTFSASVGGEAYFS